MQSSHTGVVLAIAAIAGVAATTEKGITPAAGLRSTKASSVVRALQRRRRVGRFCACREQCDSDRSGKPGLQPVVTVRSASVHSLRRLDIGVVPLRALERTLQTACSSRRRASLLASQFILVQRELGFCQLLRRRRFWCASCLCRYAAGWQPRELELRDASASFAVAGRKCYASDSLAKRVAKAWSSHDGESKGLGARFCRR